MGFKDGTNNVHGDDQATMAEFVWVGDERAAAWMPGRHLPRRPPDPDADRDLGPLEPRRPGGDDRPPQGQRRAARRHGTSTTRSTWPRSEPTASRSSRSTRTSGSPAPDHERRDADPAPRLLVHRRHRPVTGQLDAGLFFIASSAIRGRASSRSSAAGRERRAERVHRPHRQRGLRLPAWNGGRRLMGGRSLRLRRSTVRTVAGPWAQSAAGPKIERTRSATARPRARWPAASRWIPSSGLTAATSPASRKSTPASAATSR